MEDGLFLCDGNGDSNCGDDISNLGDGVPNCGCGDSVLNSRHGEVFLTVLVGPKCSRFQVSGIPKCLRGEGVPKCLRGESVPSVFVERAFPSVFVERRSQV